MGFASMLEDIVEKLGGQYPMVIIQEVDQGQRPTVQDLVGRRQALKSSHLQAAYQREFPRRFANTATPMLAGEGVPSYLRQLFLGWTYDLMTRRRSTEESWQEFVIYGMPLVTEHLNEGDPATLAFIQRISNPRDEGRRRRPRSGVTELQSIPQRALMIATDQPPKPQPPYVLVGMEIDPLTSRTVAKVRISSTQGYLVVDVGEVMQGMSKSARRKAIRYGKPLPAERGDQLDKVVLKAVADCLANRAPEVAKRAMPHRQVRSKKKMSKGQTWPRPWVLYGGLPDSSRRRH